MSLSLQSIWVPLPWTSLMAWFKRRRRGSLGVQAASPLVWIIHPGWFRTPCWVAELCGGCARPKAGERLRRFARSYWVVPFCSSYGDWTSHLQPLGFPWGLWTFPVATYPPPSIGLPTISHHTGKERTQASMLVSGPVDIYKSQAGIWVLCSLFSQLLNGEWRWYYPHGGQMTEVSFWSVTWYRICYFKWWVSWRQICNYIVYLTLTKSHKTDVMASVNCQLGRIWSHL